MKNSMTIAIAEIDKSNLIGNIYTKEAITQMYNKCKDAIENGFFGGELVRQMENHKYTKTLDLSRVTHQVTKVDIVDGFLVADVSFTDNTEGNLAMQAIKSGSGILRPTIIGSIDPATKNVNVSTVISFDIIPYYSDFRVDISWKTIR
jgi:hypothetical protein